jgi:hypothetical protein
MSPSAILAQFFANLMLRFNLYGVAALAVWFIAARAVLHAIGA